MEIYKLQQLAVTLSCLLSGALCAFLFDLLRAAHKALKLNAFQSAMCDIFFWLCCTAAVYGAIYFSNDGDLRWFELIGLFCGAFGYLLLLSNKLFPFAHFLVKLVYKFFCLIKKTAGIPGKLLHIITLPAKKFINGITPRMLYVLHTKFAAKKPKEHPTQQENVEN